MPPSFLLRLPWMASRLSPSFHADMKAFLPYFDERNLHARRLALMVGIFFFAIFGFHDAVFLSGKKLYILWGIRYLLMIPLGLFFLLWSFRSKGIQKYLEPIVATLTCMCAFSMIYMLAIAPDTMAAANFMIGILLVTFVGYSIFRLSFFWASVTGMVIFLAYLGALPWLPLEIGYATSYALQLLCGNIAFMMGAFVTENVFYREFLSLKKLEAQREEIETLNTDLEKRVEERTRTYNEKALEAESLILKQQAVERTLRMTEKQHRDLLEVVEDACFEMDREGRILFFNTALCRITGRQPAEIRANRFYCWLNVEDATLLRKLMETMGRTGGTRMLSLSLENPEGELLSIRLSVSPIEDGQSHISGFRCVGRDMSREARLKTDLQKIQEYRDQADSRHFYFLRSLAFSLRTPLNALVGGLHLLMENGFESTKQVGPLGEAAERMQRVLDDIQDYAQMAEGRWAPLASGSFSPESTGRDVCQAYARLAEIRGLAFLFETKKLPDFLQGDARFLSRILTKLLDNALRFTDRGKIEIFMGCREIAGVLWLTLEVSDTGCGMDAEQIAKAFEAPYRMDSSYGMEKDGPGLGLGLAFIRLMMEEMEGHIRIHSQPGKGTRVLCELPVHPSHEKKPEYPFVSQKKEESIRVLLVEDNLINQKITLKLLEKNGYIPDLAENGLEALEKLALQTYDLVLMDVQMPEMDGLTATRKIREGACGDLVRMLPIVAFTAHTTLQDREACLQAGMDEVITKPVKPDVLHATVEKWARTKTP